MRHNQVRIANSLLMCLMAVSVMSFQSGMGIGDSNHSIQSKSDSHSLLLQNPNDTHLIVNPPTGPLTVGQAITIPITINTIPNTRSAQFGLTFDKTVLRCDSVDEGTFFSDWVNLDPVYSAMVFPTPSCDNVTGTVRAGGIFILGPETGGPNGTGVVFTYHFTALANGTSPLNLISAEVYADTKVAFDYPRLPITLDHAQLTVGPTFIPTHTSTVTPTYSATPTHTSTVNPTATITPTQTPTFSATPTNTNSSNTAAPNPTSTPIQNACMRSDVNQDGVVSVGDLTTVSLHMGETGVGGWIREDITWDGIISVGDLLAIESCLGWRTDSPNNNPTPTATVTRISLPTLTLASATAQSSTEARVSVYPKEQVMTVGQQFTWSIYITTTKPSRGAQVGISFDARVLKCDSMTKGDFYSTWAASHGATASVFPPPVINNTTGKISPTGYFLLGGTGGPSGGGTLFEVQCTAVNWGKSIIRLTDVEVNDDNQMDGAGKLTVTIFDGAVYVNNPTFTPFPPVQTNTPVPTTPLPTIESNSHIGFSPAQVIVPAVGAAFTVDVVITNADKPVRGIQANVKFDPQIMECSAVEEGTFLKDWALQNGGNSLLFPYPIINNAAGTITNGADFIVGALIGPEEAAGGATGAGSFLKLTCKAKAYGVGKLTLENVELAGDKLDGFVYDNSLAVVIDSGEVLVGVMPTPTPLGVLTPTQNACIWSDVNQDGAVSVGDLTTVGLHMGETGAPGWIREDVNQDGAVTVGDLLAIGSCLGWTTDPPNNNPTPTVTSTGTPTLAPTPTRLATIMTPIWTSTPFPYTPLPTSTWLPTMMTRPPTNTPVPYTPLPTIESNSHIGFSPAQVIAPAVGAAFTVDVVITNADKPVRAIAANVKFDPQIMECSAVEEGTFLKDWALQNGGNSLLFPYPIINNAAGTIFNGADIIIGAQIGPDQAAGGATGAGSFLKLTCKAKAYGVGKLTLENVELSSDKLDGYVYRNSLAVVIDSGEVLVGVMPTPTPLGGLTPTPAPNACVNSDVNQDGAVNVWDLIVVRSHLRESGAPGWIRSDVNRDGVITFEDLKVLWNCLGTKITPTLGPPATSTGTPATPTPTAIPSGSYAPHQSGETVAVSEWIL